MTFAMFMEMGAFCNAAAASHAGIKSVVVGRIVNKLVHESLTEALELSLSADRRRFW